MVALRSALCTRWKGGRGRSEGCMTTSIATSYKVMPRPHRHCCLSSMCATPFHPSRQSENRPTKFCFPSISLSCHLKASPTSSRLDLPTAHITSCWNQAQRTPSHFPRTPSHVLCALYKEIHLSTKAAKPKKSCRGYYDPKSTERKFPAGI